MDNNSVILSNSNEISQIDGFERSVEEVFLKIGFNELSELIDGKQFLVEIVIIINENTYKYTNIFTNNNIDSQKYISVGTIYVMGPINEADIKYNATITFITST